ncbi:hypothetical protein Tco_1576800 [Tanacetum coccineum]
MIKSSNGETSFSLTYGTEAVILAEIGMPTLWTAEVDLIKNNEALEINLDLIKEKREQAAIQEAKSKAKMKKYYNSKVRGTSFKPGDMVYRNNDASHAKDGVSPFNREVVSLLSENRLRERTGTPNAPEGNISIFLSFVMSFES